MKTSLECGANFAFSVIVGSLPDGSSALRFVLSFATRFRDRDPVRVRIPGQNLRAD